MVSIARNTSYMLVDDEVTSFHHALSVSTYDIHDMNREQLLQLCLEQHALILLITSIVYNVYAKATTRIVALDAIFTASKRVARHTMEGMFDFMPVDLVKVAEKIGASKNTVGSAYTSLEACGAIRKNHRYEDEKGRPTNHLDIAITSIFLNNPACVEDATEAAKAERKDKRTKCVNCGSERTDTYKVHFCKDCGYSHFEELNVDRSDIGGQCLQIVPTASQEATTSVSEIETPIVHAEIEPLKNASESIIEPVEQNSTAIETLVAMLAHYKVKHLDYMTCHCGCKLFHKVLGEWSCARCEPGNFWPDNYINAIKAVYPGKAVRA